MKFRRESVTKSQVRRERVGCCGLLMDAEVHTTPRPPAHDMGPRAEQYREVQPSHHTDVDVACREKTYSSDVSSPALILASNSFPSPESAMHDLYCDQENCSARLLNGEPEAWLEPVEIAKTVGDDCGRGVHASR